MDESSLEQTPSRNTSNAASAIENLNLLDLESKVSIDACGIAPSPFATLSQQEIASENERRTSYERVESGDLSSNGTDGDSVIVSSINTAMTQLRAASLPAALIRPPQNIQGELVEVCDTPPPS